MFIHNRWYNKVYSCDKLTNEDYPSEKVILNSHLVNCDIQPGYGISRFNSGELIEAYNEGRIYGKLKEIASSLKDEDNDILVLYKFK